MRHSRRLAPATLFVSSLAVGLAGAQTPPRPPDLLLPVSTEVVRIDVVVTGKGDRPRQGLTRGDFVILEDGQAQQISQFEAIVAEPDRGARPAPGVAQRPTSGDEGGEATARPAPPRRYVVLAVDDIHIDSANLLHIKKALDRFLEREVGPEDLIALITTSGTRGIFQEFTDDRYAIRRAVGRLSVQDRTVVPTRIPYITEYQAEQIERGDAEALRVAVQEIVYSGLYQDEDSATPLARQTSHEVFTESVNNARLTLETLDGVVRSLSDLQGRKVVVLISDGFLAGLSTGSGAAFDIRRITDASTRAGVVLYALDSRGLVATTPGRSASNRMPTIPSTFSARELMDRESEFAVLDSMGALTADTGGFLVRNSNDLGTGIRRILKDTETYYAIAYEPTNPKRDGGFRKIEVRLPEVRDVRIRARKGYFAPDDRKAYKGPAVAVSTPSGPAAPAEGRAREDEERRDAAMKVALTSPTPSAAIPVRLSADFVSLDAGGPQVVVSSYVDLKGMPFDQDGGRRVANLAAAAAVFDESGAVVGTLTPEHVALSLTDASYEKALKDGLLYQKATALKPGRYRVRFAVREDRTGKVGSASHWVQVPDLADGKFALSSLFLMKKDASAGDASAETSATESAAPLSLREVQAVPRFKRSEDLYLQLFAYNPKPDASGATNLLTQAEIWRGGALLASSPPEPMTGDGRPGASVAHTRSIKLAPFAPGDYEVRVVITDRNDNEMIARKAGFTIE